MAKNDYFAVVYRILAYLYECFKAGEKPDMECISPEELEISRGYWKNIFESLVLEGYIRGVSAKTNWNGVVVLEISGGLKITEKGIEFLQSNSMIARVKDKLKDIKGMIPGI